MPEQQDLSKRGGASPPPLHVDQIITWAREHYARTGAWPGPMTPGIIPGTQAEKWKNLDWALRAGRRGLPRSTLMELLGERCGVRNCNRPPPLAIEQILVWADSHHARTGKWPGPTSGPIAEAEPETWLAVAHALESGLRGLTGKSSLPCLLAERRGVRNQGNLPQLTETQILAWADEHYRRTQRWPTGCGTPSTSRIRQKTLES